MKAKGLDISVAAPRGGFAGHICGGRLVQGAKVASYFHEQRDVRAPRRGPERMDSVTRWMLVIAMLGALLIAGYFFERKHQTAEITAAEYGADWPWPGASKAVLHCHEVERRDGVRGHAALVTLNGATYALDAPGLEASGWTDARAMMARARDGHVIEKGRERIAARAMGLCGA